MARDFRC